MFRTAGQSDQYWAFATMWRVPDNLLHVIFNINASFGSDYFVLISQHNLWEKIHYIAIYSAYPAKGEIWIWGENGSITPTCIPQKDEHSSMLSST